MPDGKKIKKSMNRMRQKPSLLDYCYVSTRTNLSAMKFFRNVTLDTKKIIDIGCGTKPFEIFFEGKDYIGLDFQPFDNSVISHDLNDPLPFENNSVDAIIMSEVLEHHPDPYKLLKEVDRVITSSAKIFISTPFALPVHGSPYDFHRYTNYFYQHLSEKYDWEVLYFESSNSIFSTPFFLMNQISLGLPLPSFLLRPFWFFSNLCGLLLDHSTKIFNMTKRSKVKNAFPMGYCAVYTPRQS